MNDLHPATINYLTQALPVKADTLSRLVTVEDLTRLNDNAGAWSGGEIAILNVAAALQTIADAGWRWNDAMPHDVAEVLLRYTH